MINDSFISQLRILSEKYSKSRSLHSIDESIDLTKSDDTEKLKNVYDPSVKIKNEYFVLNDNDIKIIKDVLQQINDNPIDIYAGIVYMFSVNNYQDISLSLNDLFYTQLDLDDDLDSSSDEIYYAGSSSLNPHLPTTVPTRILSIIDNKILPVTGSDLNNLFRYSVGLIDLSRISDDIKKEFSKYLKYKYSNLLRGMRLSNGLKEDASKEYDLLYKQIMVVLKDLKVKLDSHKKDSKNDTWGAIGDLNHILNKLKEVTYSEK